MRRGRGAARLVFAVIAVHAAIAAQAEATKPGAQGAQEPVRGSAPKTDPLVELRVAPFSQLRGLAQAEPFRIFFSDTHAGLRGFASVLWPEIEELSLRVKRHAKTLADVERCLVRIEPDLALTLAFEVARGRDTKALRDFVEEKLKVEPKKHALVDSPIEVQTRSNKSGSMQQAWRGRRAVTRSAPRLLGAADDASLFAAFRDLRKRPQAGRLAELKIQRIAPVAEQMGLGDEGWGEMGLDASLQMVGNRFVERVRLSRLPIDAKLLAAVGKPSQDLAKLLPGQALLCVRIELASRAQAFRVVERLAKGIDWPGIDAEWLGRVCGKAKAGDTSATLAVFFLPPAAGSPMPEPGFALRVGGDGRSAKQALNALAKKLWAARPQDERPEVPVGTRSLGRGESTLPYLRVPEHIDSNDKDRQISLRMLLGGGFTSVLRKDGWLIVGCNPRSMRRIQRGPKTTLADRADFASAWASTKPIVGFASVEALAGKHSSFTTLIAPIFMTVAPMVFAALGQRVGVRMNFRLDYGASDLRKFLQIVKPVTFVAEPTQTGLEAELTGGAMLSPCAWASVFAALGFEIGRLRVRQ